MTYSTLIYSTRKFIIPKKRGVTRPYCTTCIRPFTNFKQISKGKTIDNIEQKCDIPYFQLTLR